MSLKRRLGGCFLLVLLGVLPLLAMFHAVVHFHHSTGVAEKVVLCFVYLGVLLGGCYQLALEAHQSRLGMLLRADAVAIDDVANYIDQCSADATLEINFKVSNCCGFAGSSVFATPTSAACHRRAQPVAVSNRSGHLATLAIPSLNV